MLGLSSLRAQEVAQEPAIELPRFVVTDSRELPQPEAWRYGTIPGFEILTNASDKATQRLIKDFETFRMALGYVWPMPTRPGPPTALIICGKKGKFDAFLPPTKSGDPTIARASLFLKAGNRSAIVLDFETSVLSVLATESDDAATGLDSSRFEVDHNKQLYREYVHYLLGRSEPRLPAWFEEGMAQIIMAMKVESKLIQFGKIEDPNLVSAQAAAIAQLNADAAADPDAIPLGGAPVEDRDFNAALQRKALMSFPQFFAVAHDAPEAVNPLGNNRWAKQAYAFVHLCLYGENGRFNKSFGLFLGRIAKGEAVTEPMFKECFNMSYNAMLTHLRGYIDFTVYTSKEFRAKGEGLPQPPPLVLRDATQSEIGRIKGETLLLAGRKDAAHAELIAPYVRGERDPALLAALGLDEHAAGQDERARKFLEAAVAGKAVRPEAYVELARMRYADALAKPLGTGGRFSPAQTTGIVGPLTIARQQVPPLSSVYELMADAWFRSDPPTKEEAALLIEGARLFPGRLRLIYQAASLCASAGILDAAHTLAAHGIAHAPDAATKASFEQLKASFPAGPAPAADAAKGAPPLPTK